MKHLITDQRATLSRWDEYPATAATAFLAPWSDWLSKNIYALGYRELPGRDADFVETYEIVDVTDFLIATPASFEEEQRSGTWATIRYIYWLLMVMSKAASEKVLPVVTACEADNAPTANRA